jgi:hypothetical protein
LNSFLISFFDFELVVLTTDMLPAGVGEEDEQVIAADDAEEQAEAEGVP